MKVRTLASRHRAFGLISHITPVAVPIFLGLFYVPILAAPLRASGWNLGAALGVSLLLFVLWMGLGTASIAIIPSRFVKLSFALQFLLFGLPLFGVFGIMVWIIIRTLWHMMR
ncbi:hypothetical protein EON83_15875 [bacterium]|nr:MAG: hypothetical protein EON83_15875 [bacterium]